MAEVEKGEILAGKYRVEKILGEGGMGFVVAATHIVLDEPVALKFMRAGAMGREDGAQRFLREARAAVKLKSEHVARVLDVGTLETGAPYIVMEHLEGADLAQVLAEGGVLPLGEAVDFILQACDAIAEAHLLGIIHRDLKPANLFVTRGRDGAPLIKVLDFGISKFNVLGDVPESVTNSRMLLGSPSYMSPEQMKSSRDVGPTTDVWSIGVILYEALTGRLPFRETTMGALMAQVLTERPPMPPLEQCVPSELAAVVARCLEKDPAHRYATVTELALALAPFAPASSGERVSRILGMSGASSRIPVPSSRSLSPLSATDHPSILGIASTQIDRTTQNPAAPPKPTRQLGVYAAVAVAALGVAIGAFVGTRSMGAKGTDRASVTSTVPADGARTQPASAPPPGPADEASAQPASSSSVARQPTSPSVAPASKVPQSASAIPLPRARTITGQHGPASPSSSAKPSVDAGDAFGNQRY